MDNVGNLAKLKQWLFPNKATTLSVQAIGWCDDIFGEELMWEDVRNTLLPTLYKITPKRDEMIQDEPSASRFILSLIASFAEREVSSGRFHIYLGVLGFDGRSLRSIAEIALSQLYDNEWLSYDSYQDQLERLDEEVKGAG